MDSSIFDLRNPLFGIALTFLAYLGGRWLQLRTGKGWLSPVLTGAAAIIGLLLACDIPLESYRWGGHAVMLFLGPCTVALALPLHRQHSQLRAHLLPVLLGAGMGSWMAIASTRWLGAHLGLDAGLVLSLLPKSVTTPVGIELSRLYGGIPAVTVASIVMTGIWGMAIGSGLFRLLRISHPVAQGVALGTASHAIGTSRALAMGETQGAMSGLCIALAGLFTTAWMALGL
jgi:predicted murein hydrolase (TIGR00659 family)